MRRLGNAFKALTEKRAGKPLESLKISLVTNQPVSPEWANIFAEARTGRAGGYKRWLYGEVRENVSRGANLKLHLCSYTNALYWGRDR